MSKSYKIKKRRKKKPGFLLALLTNRAPCFPLDKHVPQISTGGTVDAWKAMGNSRAELRSLPFLCEKHFKQAQQPRLHGEPHHQSH